MDAKEYTAMIARAEVPPEPPDADKTFGFASVEARQVCVYDHGVHAMIAKTWVDKLAAWIGNRKVLEIMAGTGLLAKALHQASVDITATDSCEWYGPELHVFPVEKLEASEAVAAYPQAEVLLCCWPPYTSDAIVEACKKWGSQRPIVYIGEGFEGCNAPNTFFEHFVEDKSVDIYLPQWWGLHDYIMIGKWSKNGRK